MLAAIVVLTVLLVCGFRSFQKVQSTENSQNYKTKHSDSRPSREENTLARVCAAAQRKLPSIRLVGRENIVFAALNENIDEVNVMEVLLSVESEFHIEIPDSAITDRIGREHRRDLVNHRSLSELARVVEELRRESGP